MRIFTAIMFPEEAHQQLYSICESLQTHLHAVQAPNVLRWVPVQNIHLTLRLLGEITLEQAHIVAMDLQEVAIQPQPFTL